MRCGRQAVRAAAASGATSRCGCPSSGDVCDRSARDQLRRRYATAAAAAAADEAFITTQASVPACVGALAATPEWRDVLSGLAEGTTLGADSPLLRAGLRASRAASAAACAALPSALRRALLASVSDAMHGQLTSAALSDRHQLVYAAAYLTALQQIAGESSAAGRAAVAVFCRLVARTSGVDAAVAAQRGSSAASATALSPAAGLWADAAGGGADDAAAAAELSVDLQCSPTDHELCVAAAGGLVSRLLTTVVNGSASAAAPLAWLTGIAPALLSAAAEQCAAVTAAAADEGKCPDGLPDSPSRAGPGAHGAAAAAALTEAAITAATGAARRGLAATTASALRLALKQSARWPLLSPRAAAGAAETAAATTEGTGDAAECGRLAASALTVAALQGAGSSAVALAAKLPNAGLRALFLRLLALVSAPPYSPALCRGLLRIAACPEVRAELKAGGCSLDTYLPAGVAAGVAAERSALRKLLSTAVGHADATAPAPLWLSETDGWLRSTGWLQNG
eukprot:TRINITY_DN9277_c0_g1_i7.p1 TRINITY_DN9277_c0_g1~~TRINITY_DN9277_c0_g1_i7.p1  ORF type:complete len:513 (+),score=120.15 TRINITY_DN9277_c0_g1_i7:250-1788(+)